MPDPVLPERWDELEPLFDHALDLAPDTRAAFVREVDDPELRDALRRLLHADRADGPLDGGAAGFVPALFGAADDAEGDAEGDARWRDVQRLFVAALELPPAERLRALDEQAPTPEVQAEVASLLDLVGGATGYLAELAGAAPPARPPAHLGAGSQLGAYRVVRPLGHGGTATVYLAERADGHFERQVALKVLHPNRASATFVRRFLQERQILADLRHPNIARLLDGGMTPDGRPYLAMEYVEGVPITDYAARHAGVRERLRLFADVCRAVQAAHGQLVVHRDLKPSNVLVTEDAAGRPHVKLLDFGIAKLLSTETAVHTGTDAHVLTPAYAAPEQVLGGAVTTATDVYGLGLLLFELLVDRRPFEGAGARTLREEVLVADPPRPSEVCPERRRALRGDLDTICLKALRKDPADRYRTAEALLDDVTRHLESRPVAARRGDAAYRLRTFARRHRAGLAAAAFSVLLLVGYGVTTTLQARRIAAERDRAQHHQRLAEREARRFEATRDFVVGLFAAADPYEDAAADTLTAADLLALGHRRIEDLDVDTLTRATLLNTVGVSYRGMGHPAACSVLEESQALYETSLGLHDLASLDNLDDLARCYQHEHDTTAARIESERAWRASETALGADDPATLRRLAAAVDASRRHRPERAAAWMERLLRRRARLDSTVLADALFTYAKLLRRLDRPEEAVPVYEELIALEQHAGAELASVLHSFSFLESDLGRPRRAEAAARRALGIMVDSLGQGHLHTQYVRSSLIKALRLQGRYDEAAAEAEQGAERYRSVHGETWRYGSFLSRAVQVHTDEGAYERAAAVCRRVLAVYHADLGPDHRWSLRTELWLGALLHLAGQPHEAAGHLERALAYYERTPPQLPPALVDVVERLADRLAADGSDPSPYERLVARSGA